MLKNKIYKYLSVEIFKNFVTILFTFTAIAWAVRSVNFLDLMVEDGHSSSIYFKYSLLNLTTIMSRFVPLSILLSLTISIIKFERQQELLILWSSGLSKIKIVNVFLSVAFLITLFQLLLSSFINPFFLNKSRHMLSETQSLQINSVLKSNDFSDSFKSITFFIEKKDENEQLINIFIKDTGGNINTIKGKNDAKKDTTIIAKKGFIDGDKLILFNGNIQTLNEENDFQTIQFEKTELSLGNISPRTIKQPKIQETSSSLLLNCLLNKNFIINLTTCADKNYNKEVIQTLSRRMGSPLYIPLITIIISFLLINKNENKFNFLNKYILFIISFIILILAEILLKYTGFASAIAVSYFIIPLFMFLFSYVVLFKKIKIEKITK